MALRVPTRPPPTTRQGRSAARIASGKNAATFACGAALRVLHQNRHDLCVLPCHIVGLARRGVRRRKRPRNPRMALDCRFGAAGIPGQARPRLRGPLPRASRDEAPRPTSAFRPCRRRRRGETLDSLVAARAGTARSTRCRPWRPARQLFGHPVIPTSSPQPLGSAGRMRPAAARESTRPRVHHVAPGHATTDPLPRKAASRGLKPASIRQR